MAFGEAGEAMKLTPQKAEALAEDIYEAISKQLYAKEVSLLLKKHGLVNLKDVKDWVRRKESENETKP